MDRERFDALARFLGKEGSRRGALGALLGAVVLGSGPEAEAKKKHKKKKKHKNHDQSCFGTLECEFPSDGKDFRNCDLAQTKIGKCNGCSFRGADLAEADFEDGSFQGASFREANLRGADLDSADLSGASFRDACLVGAEFPGANIDGADFRDAIFCNTVLPDGSEDNSGCDDLTDCCPPCLYLGQACGEGIFGECCNSLCINGVCAYECVKDTDCPGGDICCGGLCFAGECCEGFDCEPFGNLCVGLNCQCGDGASCLQSTRCCGEGHDGECVDLENDDDNCGFCGNVCEPPQNCEEGTCGVG